MTKKPLVLLSDRVARFLELPHNGFIMFLKRYKVDDAWDIGPGAIIELSEANIKLIKICQQLYNVDNTWFVGDILGLMAFETSGEEKAKDT